MHASLKHLEDNSILLKEHPRCTYPSGASFRTVARYVPRLFTGRLDSRCRCSYKQQPMSTQLQAIKHTHTQAQTKHKQATSKDARLCSHRPVALSSEDLNDVELRVLVDLAEEVHPALLQQNAHQKDRQGAEAPQAHCRPRKRRADEGVHLEDDRRDRRASAKDR